MSKRKYNSVSEDKLKKALEEVAGGVSQRDVAKKYATPRGTLQNKISKRNTKACGHSTVLTQEEAYTIVAHVIALGDWGFPLDHTGERCILKTYLMASHVSLV